MLAERLEAVAIVTVTHSGRTAHLLSNERTDIPIYAFSPDLRLYRRLAMWWGVVPIHHPLHPGDILSAERMTEHLRHMGVCGEGDRVVVVGVHDGDLDKPIGIVLSNY